MHKKKAHAHTVNERGAESYMTHIQEEKTNTDEITFVGE